MLGKEFISTQFKDALAAQKTPSGQKGVQVGRQSLFRTVLPLTHHLVNVVWKEKTGDSTQLAAAKTAARGLTYFFTLLTAAPLYQFLMHALPKTVLTNNHTQYAKAILESLKQYNDLRHKIIRAGDHERDYLAPQNIEQREAEIDANGGIVIKLSPEDQAKAKDNIRLLQREKTEHYDRILGEQVKAITAYLQGLDPEERPTAYKEILGSFMTHVGFEDVFFRSDERLHFALEISNRIGVALITEETQTALNELVVSYNFIKFNDRLENLAKEISTIFGITPAVATSLVAHSVKERIESVYGSTERFSAQFSAHVADASRIDTVEFKVFIDSLQNNYKDAIDALQDEYDRLVNGAVLKDAEQSLGILNKEIAELRAQARKLTHDLKVVNEKLQVLGNKGSYYRFRKIKQTRVQLEQAKRDINVAYKAVLKGLQEKLHELAQINNAKDVNFNGAEVQALKKVADEKLELERKITEAQANLGVKNTRAFRACMSLLKGVAVDKPAEVQFAQVSELAKHLNDEKSTFATKYERVMNAFGLGPKMKPVALFDVLRNHLNTFSLDSLQARDSVRSAYEKMTPAQKNYFAQEVARQAGQSASFFKTKALTAFGAKYIQAYISGDVAQVDGVSVSPQLIKHVIDSDAGKNAALYQPRSTRLYNYVMGARV